MKNFKYNLLVLGGDGYLGWSLGLALAKRSDFNVILVDNLIKRKWEEEVRAKPLVSIDDPLTRITKYKEIFNRSNLFFKNIDLCDFEATSQLIRHYKPVAIINAAQQPSAPFSMMSPKHAALTFSNNTVTNLNVLWAIAEIDKTIKYIKLGSAGCYLGIDTDFVPIEKVDLNFKYKENFHKVTQCWLPMSATDFYHQSKVNEFLIDDTCSSMWGLKVVTVQQSTIFGATIEENYQLENHGLATRFNYDQIFGTVLNRFVCQIAVEYPLTVYGHGEQRTGMISLSDTVNNFVKLLDVDLKQGTHRVEHNYTHKLSINEIVDIFQEISPNLEVHHITNPRVEIVTKLANKLDQSDLFIREIKSNNTIKEEFAQLLRFAKLYKDRIDKSIIAPTISWKK